MSTVAYAPAPNAQSRYGASFLAGSQQQHYADTQLTAVAGPSASDHVPIWHPDHPGFWLGAILAGAVGLAYFSTTVRVGPAQASASVGKK